MPLNAHFKMTTLREVEPGDLICLSFMEEATLAIILHTYHRFTNLGLLQHSTAPFTHAKVEWPSNECLSYGKDWQIAPRGPVEFADQLKGKNPRHQGGALVMHNDATILNFKRRPSDHEAQYELIQFDLATSEIRTLVPPQQDVVFTSWEIFMPERPKAFLERQSLLIR